MLGSVSLDVEIGQCLPVPEAQAPTGEMAVNPPSIRKSAPTTYHEKFKIPINADDDIPIGRNVMKADLVAWTSNQRLARNYAERIALQTPRGARGQGYWPPSHDHSSQGPHPATSPAGRLHF
jgi:hypothetical protein